MLLTFKKRKRQGGDRYSSETRVQKFEVVFQTQREKKQTFDACFSFLSSGGVKLTKTWLSAPNVLLFSEHVGLDAEEDAASTYKQQNRSWNKVCRRVRADAGHIEHPASSANDQEPEQCKE